MIKYVSVAAIGLSLLGGCDAGLQGGPKESINPDRDFNEIIINGTLNKERLEFLARLPVVDAATRNAIVEARMAEIDVLYFEYETNISAEIRRGNFATSLAGIVIGAVGGQASGAAAANYAALGGVLSGASAAYQKEVLLDQSVQAFVSQMRANRNTKKTEILGKLAQAGTVYTLQSALSDLAAYHQAGTLASAVAGITEKAQQEEQDSKNTLQSKEISVRSDRAQTVSAPAPKSASLNSITSYVAGGGTDAEQRTRNTQANTCFDEAEVANKPPTFTDYILAGDSYLELGTAITACLNTRFGAGL